MKIYSQQQTHIPFEGKLVDSATPTLAKSLENNTRLFVWMRNCTDGMEYEYPAVPKDPTNLPSTYIRHVTLKQFPSKGDYTWTVGAEFSDGTNLVSPIIGIFFVV